MRSRAAFRDELELFAKREATPDEEIPTCPSCMQRPAWSANRLPCCEVCFNLASGIEKAEYWRALDRAFLAPDMQVALRDARARLIRATRMG